MTKLRVHLDPRVYNKTARTTKPRETAGRRVGCVCIPGAGTVSAGAGAVSLGPTRTVPVRNPIDSLRLSANEWARVGQFADLLSVRGCSILLLLPWCPCVSLIDKFCAVCRRSSTSFLLRTRLYIASCNPCARNTSQGLVISFREIKVCPFRIRTQGSCK
jgi:hypothetical protein